MGEKMALQDNKTARPVNPKALTNDDLVDTKTAARILGLRNHHTLEVWRSTKRHPGLRYHRVGRAVRYRIADLQAFLTANAVGLRVESNGASTANVGKGESDVDP